MRTNGRAVRLTESLTPAGELVFQVPWARLESWPGDLERLKEQGFTVAAMELTEDAVDRFGGGVLGDSPAGLSLVRAPGWFRL